MTREQAINYLISSGFSDEQVSEVVRALTYEPTIKNDFDCISRADAIKAMQDKAKKLTNEDTINGLCGAVAILFDMPSVTPQETREVEDYENEIADLHNRLDIAEYDKERFREEVTNLEAKIKVQEQEPCDKCEVGNPCLYCKHEFEAKTGHWIKMPIGFKCSNCNELEDRTTKFCPNCGCCMVEPQESEE